MGTAASPRIALLAVAAACLAHVAAALLFHPITWDDSAITLGFARTFAESGKISPTFLSDRVEGYSTPLWMLVNAGAYLALRDPGSLLLFAKTASLALNIANIVFLFALIRNYGSTIVAGLTAITFAAPAVTLYESINGMEHPLFTFLLLASFWGYRAREQRGPFLCFLAASTLLVAVRWEALWFVAPFFLRSVVEGGWRRAFAIEHLLWSAIFAALTAFRLAYFGDLLPNTIIAKSNAPYAMEGLAILWRTGAVSAALLPVLPGLLVLAGLWLAQRMHGGGSARGAATWLASRDGFCAAGIVVAGLIFVFAIGENWGPRGRMFFPALPFALIVLAAWLGEAEAKVRAPLRLSARLGLLAVGLLMFAVSYRQLAAPLAPLYMQRVTVANIAMTASAMEKLRQATRRETLTVAAPDMGGLLLYSSHLRVVDIGLLCSRPLAKLARAAIASVVFDQENADVIAVHWLWGQSVLNIAAFYERYTPVFVDGLRLFLRRDLVQAARHRFAERAFDASGDGSDYDRGSAFAHQNATDREINRRFGRYLVLAEEN
jgi:hypothetical protein